MARLLAACVALALLGTGAVAGPMQLPAGAAPKPAHDNLASRLATAEDLDRLMARVGARTEQMGDACQAGRSDALQHRLKWARADAEAAWRILPLLRRSFEDAGRLIGARAGVDSVDATSRALDDVRRRLEEAMRQLEAEDRMGCLEIQDMARTASRARSLASEVLRQSQAVRRSLRSLD